MPTINRLEELRVLLLSLQEQSFKSFEVIIVDQNSDDRTLEVISEFVHSLDIRRIKLEDKGASLARNAGRALVRGKIITWPDDDAEYAKDTLERVFKIFNEVPDLDGITCSSKSKTSDGQITRLSKVPGPITKLNILRRIVEFTIFVRTDSVRGIYFDEDFGPGSKSQCWADEGPDFVLRLMAKGAKFQYFPEVIIYHPNPIKVFDEKTLARSYKYGCARGKYLKKHRYPFWFVAYVWGLYVVGVFIGLSQLNLGKIKYYYYGLRGRIKGYIK